MLVVHTHMQMCHCCVQRNGAAWTWQSRCDGEGAGQHHLAAPHASRQASVAMQQLRQGVARHPWRASLSHARCTRCIQQPGCAKCINCMLRPAHPSDALPRTFTCTLRYLRAASKPRCRTRWSGCASEAPGKCGAGPRRRVSWCVRGWRGAVVTALWRATAAAWVAADAR